MTRLTGEREEARLAGEPTLDGGAGVTTMESTTVHGHAMREPVWSGAMTSPLATRIPPNRRGQALSGIKAMHTAIFFSIAGAILLTVWDGLRGQPRRRTAVAGAVVMAETAVFVSNNQVCPLTPLAEQLGAGRGSVVDIFLPAWAARRIPVVAGSAAVLALVLNLRAWRDHSHIDSE